MTSKRIPLTKREHLRNAHHTFRDSLWMCLQVINDLLSATGKDLRLRQGSDSRFFVEGLTTVTMSSAGETLTTLVRGTANRKVSLFLPTFLLELPAC